MSDILENDAITQALNIIDKSLGTLHQRELVSSAEMSDLLLDVRSALATPSLAELDEFDEAVGASSAN